MRKFILFSIIVILQLFTGHKSEPGLSKFKIGHEFFDKVLKLITQKVIEEVNKNKSNFTEVDMNMKLANLVPLSLVIKNMSLEDFKYIEDQIQIRHTTGDEISFKISKITLILKLYNFLYFLKFIDNFNTKGKFNLNYKLWFLKDKQDEIEFDINLSTEIRLKITLTADNFISLKFDSFQFDHNIKNLNIKGDSLLNFFAQRANWFKKIINSQVEKSASGMIPNLLNNVNENLQKRIEIPYVNATLGIKLENSIIYSDSDEFFEVDLNADIEEESKNSTFIDQDGFLKTLLFHEKPVKPTKNLKKSELEKLKLTQNPKKSHHRNDNSTTFTDEVQISLDSNLINNLLKVILKNQSSFIITNEILPKDFPFKINTAYFQALIPSMYQKYPDKDLAITISLNSIPTLKLNSTENLIETDLNLAISFALVENPLESILSISSGDTLRILFDSTKEDESIHFQVKEIIVNDLAVISSQIGDISSEDVKKSINTFFSSFIYFVNNFLRVNPIKIPIIQGLKFESINIKISDEGLLEVRCKPDFIKTQFKWIKF
jgi:hypothetical protein